jgi:translation initiation factor 2B subunit (eIF-2B alpha/beta/delta family)
MQTSFRIIEDIEAMKVRGAFLITKTALEALTILSAELLEESPKSSIGKILQASDRLAASQPSMAVVSSGCHFVTDPFRNINENNLDAKKINKIITKRATLFIESLAEAQEKVAQVGAEIIRDGDVVFVISYSGTMISIFKKAYEQGKKFSIIGTESRPYCEGRALASTLVEIGIPYTIITDVALAYTLPRANYAFIGIDTLLSTGSIVNKMGTMYLALACRYHSKPLYGATSSFKFSPASLLGKPAVMKVVHDDAGIGPEDIQNNPLLTIENVFFEITPSYFFEGLITEYGLQPTAAAPTLWEKTLQTLNHKAEETE